MLNKLSLEERFWSKVKKGGPNECWPWIGSKSTEGYGNIGVPGRRITKLAHRLSWQFKNGPIPKGLCVCHRCDFPACVNPNHLFLGTRKENMEDMVKKGRHHPVYLYGELAPMCKLTEHKVREIRAIYCSSKDITQQELAERFGCDQTTISDIIRRRSWNKIYVNSSP